MRKLAVPVLLLLPALFAAPAAARAPSLSDLPTIKRIQEMADRAIEEARRAAMEAARDEKMEAIKSYAGGSSSLFAWKGIAEILKDPNEEDRYRQAAADAFRERFKGLDKDTRSEKLKREIGMTLLKLLNDKEKKVRIWVHGVLSVFWPGRAQTIGFNPEQTNYRERMRAYKEWQKFLTGR